MKHERINYTIVGAFVLGMAAILFYTIYAITGRSATSDQYSTVLDRVTGISRGTTVTFNGYKVGQVIDIEPTIDDNKTRFTVSLAIQKGWKITEDSQAMIAKPGPLSDAQIDIQEGVSATFLKSGDAITGVASQDVFEVMANLGNKLNQLSSDSITPILEQLKNDVGVFGHTMSTQIPELTENINSLVTRLQKNLEVIDTVINAENRASISELVKEASGAIRNINQLTATMDTLVTGNREDLQQSIYRVNNTIQVLNQKITSIGYQLETSSRNINEFSRQIKENPGIIIRNNPVEDKAVQ